MGWISILIGAIVAVVILLGLPKIPSSPTRALAAVAALVVMFLSFLLGSVRFVPEDRVGIVAKNALGPKLPPGKIIATGGEMGTQAGVLPPGWHLWYWPFVYDIELYPVTVVSAGEVGLLQAADGLPLPQDQIYAPEWPADRFQKMLDAEHFLTDGRGHMGPQASVLTPGSYRLNPRLFKVETVKVTNVPPAAVAVIKSNVGDEPPVRAIDANAHGLLVDRGQRGVWRQPLPPQEYYLNTRAYEVTIVSTKAHIVQFTTQAKDGDEREISVRSADGFTFPVDVRVEYVIDAQNAPIVIASLRDDKDSLAQVLNSAVRAIFRNSAERVKALDYVQQRSQQEKQAMDSLSREMAKYGITLTAVRIGNIGDEKSLGVLLKTQTDREIAQQEQITFQQQQKAAEQKKALTRTTQEAEEEKRLATANYEVKIAEADKQKAIIAAGAEAESIRIRAQAQAAAFSEIARQIGSGNTALIEMLKIVGERDIQITPRVMVNGPVAAGQAPETVAMIGTMLDSLIPAGDRPSASGPPGHSPGAGGGPSPGPSGR